MTALATFNSLASAAAAGLTNSAFNVCRGICLPRTTAILPRVQAIVMHYHHATGRYLDYETAIRVFDRIQSERDDFPFPVAFAPIADFLIREGYTSDATHHIVGHLSRHGTTAGLGRWLAPGHRTEVEILIPEIGPKRGQWGRDEDEDGEGE